MKHWMYIIFVGVIWMFMGIFLFMKGIEFLRCANLSLKSFMLIGVISLGLGILKGSFVLKKVVRRGVNRILALSLPVSIFKVYDKKFYLIIVLMIMLGAFLKWLAIPLAVRGGIDLAIGIALMKGGIDYFIIGFSFRNISYR